MPESTRVLAFDIGIRNLAWCCLERVGTSWRIHGWENYDLLAGSATQAAKDSAKRLCVTCGKKATHGGAGSQPLACAKHCPETHPALRDLSGAIVKLLPKVTELRELVAAYTKRPAKKLKVAELVEALRAVRTLPLAKVKLTKATSEDMSTLHDSIRTFVQSHAALFATADQILLENQPAFKNPTMKSVQILLFATIRDLVPGPPATGFVHAGKKVQGAVKGDAGYAARKKGSEERVGDVFQKGLVVDGAPWAAALAANQKRSDLCDAMCMCMDRLAGARTDVG